MNAKTIDRQKLDTVVTNTETVGRRKLDTLVTRRRPSTGGNSTTWRRAIGDLSAGYGGVMVSLGHKLGLYKAMAGAGPLDSKEVAARANCAERYVREWLNAQVAGAYVDYHAISDTYELATEQAAVLADENSPVFIPNAWQVPASMWLDEDKAIDAFRSGRGVAGATTTPGCTAASRLSIATPIARAWSANGCRHSTASSTDCSRGINVADVGCGHGHSTVLMAEAFPHSRFRGFDVHDASIDEARRNAEAAGVGARVDFEQARATDYAGSRLRLDLLLRLPARHGRPGRQPRGTRGKRSRRMAQ